ncbi:MAG TPA: hypothetical protein VHC47_00965 [Mucilaginibacter sp.]|nr:hypothetical protein [Mucilaginibacter sp.]
MIRTGIKPLLAIAVCATLVYSSCRKSDNAPVPSGSSSSQTQSDSQLSSQIAVNVAQTLAGHFGGVNLMDGVDSVSLSNHEGPHHDLANNPLCGFFTDSLVNYDHTSGDTTTHTGGNLTFYFNCQDGQSTGYTAYDSLYTSRKTPSSSTEWYVKQYYTIKALDPKHEFIGVDGDIYYYDSTILSCGCHSIENVNYVLNNLTVNVCGCSRDILSGTATFKAYGHNWSAEGSITFLGNHMADITINGTLYHVNLLSGKIG